MRYLFILLCMLYYIPAQSQGKKGFQVLISTDNDFLGIQNKDENYTGALKIEVLTPRLKFLGYPFYKFKEANTINVQRMAVGGNGYTPQNLKSANIVTGDRPYASLVYVSVGNTSYNTDKGLTLQSDLMMGKMGKMGPGHAQAYIHEHNWFGSTRDVPEGWHNQIGYNGAFIINYNTRLQGPLWEAKHKSRNFSWLQAKWVAKADIGNYMVNLQGGVKLNFLNANMNLLHDYNPDPPVKKRLKADRPVTATKTKCSCFRFNLFAEPHIRLAAYNATLEGLMFKDKSVYTIDHSDVKRILFEINAGLNLVIGDVIYLRYSFYGRGKEFAGGKCFHTWGGITLGVSPARWYRE